MNLFDKIFKFFMDRYIKQNPSTHFEEFVKKLAKRLSEEDISCSQEHD